MICCSCFPVFSTLEIAIFVEEPGNTGRNIGILKSGGDYVRTCDGDNC